VIEPAVEGLIEAGLVVRDEGGAARGACPLRLTPAGDEAISRLTDARRAGLTDLLEGWAVEAHPEVAEMVRQLAEALLADDEKLLADARPATVG
jgi:DNA-binding MarR family transcriptional regulator